ncbi:putative phage tail fibre protein, partial [Stigmatella aurantiaca DW4/3-1]
RKVAGFYDPELGTNITGDAFSYTRSWHTVTRLSSGKILVTGGYNAHGVLAQSLLFTP